MTAKKPTTHRDGVVSAFLSGRGPNPIPEKKRVKPGPLEKKFVNDAMREIAEQDKENSRKITPSLSDELLNVLRLIRDNQELIHLVRSKRSPTISDLAAKLGCELPNVSRRLSRMAAYGLVGFDASGKDARIKRPVWLLPEQPAYSDLDWIQLYCLTQALKSKRQCLRKRGLAEMDVVVRDLFETAAEKIAMTA
ncbi:MAG: hypothetical protein QM527_04850 [Alphaproteobacteria bacterium]|nr:hypothetical protein [Alphaproteobacteria bacterium]